MPLFDKVVYHISESIAESTRHEIGRILDANGATGSTLDRATHVVNNTVLFEGVNTLKEGAVCVTPYWVERSMELGQLQDPKHFSADKEMIFSGVVATSAGIPQGDKEVIIAGIRESGGQWREGLTRDVTHLFVTNTSSQKYETAMHFRESARIAILLPQWFDQCWSMQMRMPHHMYEFPDPPYMRRDHNIASYKAQMLVNKSDDKQEMFRSIVRVGESSQGHANVPAAGRDIWQGRTILLSSSLALDAQRRESVEARIRRNGGTVVHPSGKEGDEMAEVDRADVLVTQYRAGAAYARALATGKTIGTLAWLFCVERSGVVTSPRNQLLHYPVHNKHIEGFSDHIITVTNYQGDEREYLKKLIEVMGAKFTPTMSGRNTVVIAAYKHGNKTEKAEEWSVPIVTHKWLEDCFVEWRNLTPARKKYIDYAPGVNYGTVIGERGVGQVGLEEDPTLPPEMKNDARGREDASTPKGGEGKQQTRKNNSSTAEAPTATATSAREVAEVEDALDGGGHNEDGADVPPVDEKQVPFTPAKVGPPRGIKKTPGKTDTIKPKPLSTPVLAKRKRIKSPLEQHNESDDDDERRTSKSVPRPQTTDKAGKQRENPSLNGHNDSSEEVPQKSKPAPGPSTVDKGKGMGKDKVPPGIANPKPKAKSKPILDQDLQDISGEDEPIVAETKRTTRKAPAMHVDNDDSDENPPKPKPRAGKEKARKHTAIVVDSDGDEMHDRTKTPPRLVAKSTPKTYQSKTKAKTKFKATLPVSDPESEESVQASPSKKRHDNGGKSNMSDTPSPTSVELPNPRDLLSSVRSRARQFTPERKDSRTESKYTSSPKKSSSVKTKPQPPPRTTSVRAMAYETPSVGTPKRGRPKLRHESEDPPSPSPSPPRGNPKPTTNPSSGASRSSSFPPQIQRTPSRRSAAAAANYKLRNEVMPDVVNYENERKRGARTTGRRRKTSSTVELGNDDEESDESSESEVEVRDTKRRKVGSEKEKTRSPNPEEEDESEARPKKFVTHVRSYKRSASTDDEDESESNKRNSQAVPRKKVRVKTSVSDDGADKVKGPRVRKSSCDPKKIRVLTTKVDVREDDVKQLTKLGVKFTTSPAQCTHLVAHNYARTEKFLCAIPNVPFVLEYAWIHESSANGMVLAESDYLLEDHAMEKKHKFKLREALERARDLKKKKEKLLQGHFFYFTPNVAVDFSLMKNVIQAHGAECIQKTPTVRNLSSTRHIVSSAEDGKLWRPLAKQGFPIYSSELILTAACAQFVDWSGDSKRVEGSL